MSVTTPLRSQGCEPVESSDNRKKTNVVQKTHSCGRLTAHPEKMAECTKELVKTHVNIDFGSFLSRRTIFYKMITVLTRYRPIVFELLESVMTVIN